MSMKENIKWLEELADLLRKEKVKLESQIEVMQGGIIIIDDFVQKLETNIKNLHLDDINLYPAPLERGRNRS